MDVQTRQMNRIDLASEGEFRLGLVRVSPSTRQLHCNGLTATLEPRVMQLLVVLGKARGDVISRDELMLRCWNGVVVGDNAINRVVSLLRAAAADTCAGAFKIETIKKVGYRLTLVDGFVGEAIRAPQPTDEAKARSRRQWLLAAGATGIIATGIGFIWHDRTKPSRMARELVERGTNAQRQGLTDQTEQAIAFFKEAVTLDPNYADAWGALALSYRHLLTDNPKVDPTQVTRMIEDAAGRALALDPSNADAQVARVLSRPTYRHWTLRERDYRTLLERFPEHWLLRGTMGRLYYQVGRWSAGVPLFAANVQRDPFLPVSRLWLGQGLWSAGRLQEAERTYREALDRWPKHESVWIAAFSFLALSGKPDAALAMAVDPAAIPPKLPSFLVDRNVALARALASPNRTGVAESIQTYNTLAFEHPSTSPYAIPVLAALGAHDAAFELANHYLDDKPTTDRDDARRVGWLDTAFLFTPSLASVRSDPRFAVLTAKAGLDAYWRATRTRADTPKIS